MKALVTVIKERLLALGRGRGFWALADQGIVSGGNFLINILLARTLPPTEYGVYVIIFGVLAYLNNLHASLITYPLSLKGATANEVSLRHFASNSLLLTTALLLPLTLGVLGVTWAVGKLQLTPWILGALILWQLQETIRRALMAHLRYREVLFGDVLSYLGQAGVVWVLLWVGQPSLEAVFGVMALTSGTAGALQAFQLGFRSVDLSQVWRFAKDSWRLGRWMLLTNLTSIFNVQVLPWSLAFFHGFEAAAAYQAVVNIPGIIHPVLFSLNNLLIPAIARARFEGGIGAAWRVASGYAIQAAVLVLPYCAVLALWPHELLWIFYGSSSPYLRLEVVLRFFALCYALFYLSTILGGFLCGLEESRADFLVQLVGTLTSVTLVLPLVAWGGVVWASIGLVFIVLARIFAYLFFLKRVREKFG